MISNELVCDETVFRTAGGLLSERRAGITGEQRRTGGLRRRRDRRPWRRDAIANPDRQHPRLQACWLADEFPSDHVSPLGQPLSSAATRTSRSTPTSLKRNGAGIMLLSRRGEPVSPKRIKRRRCASGTRKDSTRGEDREICLGMDSNERTCIESHRDGIAFFFKCNRSAERSLTTVFS